MRQILLGLVCCLVLVGCASLDVSVSMLDSSYWTSPAALAEAMTREVARVTQARIDGTLAREREALKAEVHDTVRGMKDITDATRPIVLQKLDELIDATFTEVDGQFFEALRQLESRSRAANDADRAAALTAAWKAVDAGKATASALPFQISVMLRETVRNAASAEPAIQEVEKTVAMAVRGLVGDDGILDDARASAVVYAPNDYWKGTYNEAFGRGHLGNTDIAIKMEQRGDFTVKGVRLDASKITQATFKVASSAIRAVAAVYGVPIPVAGAPAGSNAMQVPDTSPDRMKAKAERQARQVRDAHVQLLESIVNRRAALEDTAATDADRKNAIEAIQAKFAALKPTLDGPATGK